MAFSYFYIGFWKAEIANLHSSELSQLRSARHATELPPLRRLRWPLQALGLSGVARGEALGSLLGASDGASQGLSSEEVFLRVVLGISYGFLRVFLVIFLGFSWVFWWLLGFSWWFLRVFWGFSGGFLRLFLRFCDVKGLKPKKSGTVRDWECLHSPKVAKYIRK